jgi:hypothetical protein
MHNNLDFELIVAREERRDLLYQAEQDRLIRLARTGCKNGLRADRWSWDRLGIRGMWHKAIAQALVKVNASKAGFLSSLHS